MDEIKWNHPQSLSTFGSVTGPATGPSIDSGQQDLLLAHQYL